MRTVDWQQTIVRLQALNSRLADIYANSVYTGSLGTSTDATVRTTAVTIGTLQAQGINFSTGVYSPFSDEDAAWAAWSDAARSCAADLNSALGSNEAWDVTHVAGAVIKQAGENLADWGGDAVEKAKPAIGIIVLILGLLLAVELAR